MNSKGQEFDVFRLLIAGIMGLMILIIILSIITYFQEQKFFISEKRMYDSFKSSLNSPNGDVVEAMDIAIRKGTVISAKSLEANYKIPAECITMTGSLSSTISIPDSQSAQIFETVTIDMFFSCTSNRGAHCDPECTISFGKPISH